MADRLAQKKIKLELMDGAIEYLAGKGYDPVFGARPVKRAIQQELETTLAKALLRGEFGEEDTVQVDAAADGGVHGLSIKVMKTAQGAPAMSA